MTGAITLADVAARTDALVVAWQPETIPSWSSALVAAVASCGLSLSDSTKSSPARITRIPPIRQ